MIKLWRVCVLQCILKGTLLAFSSLCKTLKTLKKSKFSPAPILSQHTGTSEILDPISVSTIKQSPSHLVTITFTFSKPTGWMGLIKPAQELLYLPYDVEGRNPTLNAMFSLEKCLFYKNWFGLFWACKVLFILVDIGVLVWAISYRRWELKMRQMCIKT